MSWQVYLLRCGDGTIYTGSTNDLAGRLAAHRAGKGAKYTRGRGPLLLAWKKNIKDRSSALKLEARIKRMSRPQKLALIKAKKRPGREVPSR